MMRKAARACNLRFSDTTHATEWMLAHGSLPLKSAVAASALDSCAQQLANQYSCQTA